MRRAVVRFVDDAIARCRTVVLVIVRFMEITKLEHCSLSASRVLVVGWYLLGSSVGLMLRHRSFSQ
jgi:hypothetical protein